MYVDQQNHLILRQKQFAKIIIMQEIFSNSRIIGSVVITLVM
jgi:hypothetical protein